MMRCASNLYRVADSSAIWWWWDATSRLIRCIDIDVQYPGYPLPRSPSHRCFCNGLFLLLIWLRYWKKMKKLRQAELISTLSSGYFFGLSVNKTKNLTQFFQVRELCHSPLPRNHLFKTRYQVWSLNGSKVQLNTCSERFTLIFIF